MKFDFLVAVPSYNRSDWKTFGWLRDQGVVPERIHLFVHTASQLRLYKQRQDLTGVNCHITGAKDVAGQRMAIMETLFPRPHVQLDDDITGFFKVRLPVDIDESVSKHKTSFIQAVNGMFDVARRTKSKVFGLAAVSNLMFLGTAIKRGAFQRGKHCGRSFIGLDGYRCHLNKKYGEDLQLFLSALRDRVGVIRFNEFLIESEHYKPGGCGDWKAVDTWALHREIADEFHPWLKEFGNRKLQRVLKETAQDHKPVQK